MRHLTPKFAVRLLVTAVLSIAALAALPSSKLFKSSTLARSAKSVSVHAERRAGVYANLQDGRVMARSYRGNERLSEVLQSGQARSRALALADLDGDGAPDLVAGYSVNGLGVVTVQRGNIDAYAPKDGAVFARIQKGYNPDSLLPTAETFESPEAVDFLATGDFNADGLKDVLVAAHWGGLYLLAGDGKGRLGAAERIELPGQVTALATGEFSVADGFTDIAVGLVGSGRAALVIYQSTQSGLTSVGTYQLGAEATAVQFGMLDDDPFMDAVVAAGSEITVVHGWAGNNPVAAESRAERISMPFSAEGLALGNFVWDRDARQEIAVLAHDGSVQLLEQGGIDKRNFSAEELKVRGEARAKSKGRQNLNDLLFAHRWEPGEAKGWGRPSQFGSQSAITDGVVSQGRLVRSNIARQDTEELLVLDAGQKKLNLVRKSVESHGKAAGRGALSPSVALTDEAATESLNVTDSPAAALALPQKVNGSADMVMLTSTQSDPVIVPLVAKTINVDRTDDTAAASASVCDDNAANDCSLRGAVAFANIAANSPTTINIPAGTYLLTLDPGTTEKGLCQLPNVGDLDIDLNTTVVGAGAGSTIIRQTKTNARVICLNPNVTAGRTYSISGITVAGGREIYGTGGAGIVGGAVSDSTTVSGVTIVNNQMSTTGCTPTPTSCNNYGGGGLRIEGGSLTVTNCTIGGTSLPGADQTSLTLSNAANGSPDPNNSSSVPGSGGGLNYSPGAPIGGPGTGNLVVTGTTIQNNTATSTASGGGGVDLYQHNQGTGTFSIGTTTIAGNQATGNNGVVANAGGGGGIIVETGPLTVTKGVDIKNNVAHGNGGGMYISGGSVAFDSTGGTITFSGNTAQASGAAGSGIGANSNVSVTSTGLTVTNDIQVLDNCTWTNNTGSSLSVTNLTLSNISAGGNVGTYTANNSTTNVSGNLNVSGGTYSANTGIANITGNLNISSGIFNNGTSTDLNGNFSLSGGTFNGSSGSVNAAGNFTFSGGTFTAGTSTFTFDGSGAQSINGPSSPTFNNLTVIKSGGSTLTLAVNVGIASNLTVTAGTFDLSTFTANRTASGGGTLSVASGATLKVGGTSGGQTGSNFPLNFLSNTLNANSTVEYSASGNQTIFAAPNYGHLVTSVSGTKTAGSNLTINGNLTIGSGTVLAGGANTINLAGNWVNNVGTGGFTSSGTVNFNGGGAQSITGATNFNHFTVNKGGGTLTLGANTTAAGNVTITAGTLDASSFTFNVGGNWSNTGTFTPSTSTVNFNGSGAQSITGATTFNNLTVNKSAGTLTLGANVTVNSDLTVTAGTFDLSTFTANRASSGGTLSVANGATLTIGGLNSLPSSYGTYTFGATSTTNYNGSTQAVNGGVTYGNLNISAAGTKTLQANAVIAGNLTLSAGVFDAGGKDISIAGNWTNNVDTNAFTPGSGTVTFNSTTAAQAINGTATTQTFNNLTVNKSGQTLSVGGSTTTLNINGTMTLSAGTFDKGTATTINVSGDWTNNGGTFAPTAGTVVFNSTTAGQAINGSAASQTFFNVTMNKTGQTLSVGSSTTTLGLNTLTLTAGTFDAGTATTINVSGDWTNNGAAFTPGSSTVSFNSTTAAQNINGTATTQTFNNLTVNKSGQTLSVGGSTTTLNVNTMTLTAGTFTAGMAATINVSGDWTNNGAAFTPGSSTVSFNSTTAAQNINGTATTQTFNNLTVNKSGQTLSVGGSTTTLTLNGTLTLTAGTLSAPANINVGGDWTNNGATFTPGSGTVTFNSTTAAQAINGTATTQTFNNLTVNKSGQTLSVGGSTTTLTLNAGLTISAGTFAAGTATTINVTGNFALNGGTFTQATSALNVAGDLSVASGTTFTKATGGQALTFNANGSQNWSDSTSGQDFGNVVIGGANNTVTLSTVPTLIKATNLTVNSTDTFSLNGKNFSFSAAAAVSNSGTVRLFGTETLTNVNNLDTASGTVEYVGDNTAGNLALKDFGATDYFNLTINDTNTNKRTFTLGNTLTVANNITITSGTFAPGNQTTNIAGNWTNNGTFTGTGSTVVFNGNGNAQTLGGSSSNTFNNLTINHTGAGGVTASGTLSVTGTLFVQSGTFTSATDYNNVNIAAAGVLTAALNSTINVAGNWQNDGLFNANGSTVNFNGSAAQTMSGAAVLANNTFNNLTINNANGVTLSSPAGVTGTLTLTSGAYTVGATNLTTGNGATISRSGGSLSAAPNFGTSVNVTYTGTSAITTGPEIPTSTSVLSNLTINDSGGVTLGANATVNGTLTLTSGDLKTGPTATEFTLTMPNTATSGPATNATDVVGNVKRTGFDTIAAGTPLSFGNPFNTIRIDSGTAPTDITVNILKQAPSGSIGFPTAVKRTYTITPNGGSGYSATVRFHYLDSELNGNSEGSSLNLWRYNSTSGKWEKQGQTANDTTNNWVELSGVTQFSPWTLNSVTPTAAPASISGIVITPDGTPLAGVGLRLSGPVSAVAITDADGRYSFDNVPVDNLYSVFPSRANYSFSPTSRSFNLLANRTDAVFTATPGPDVTNPLDTTEFFVRQQYLDFLNREPDFGGLNYWTNEIARCGTDRNCINARRRDVAAAFFIEAEFQQTGSYIYGLYKASFGQVPSYATYAGDKARLIASPNLDANKSGLTEEFVSRAEFINKYPSNLSADAFVAQLLENVKQNSGVDLSSMQTGLVNDYNQTQSRARVLRAVVEANAFSQAEYNKAFVLAEYFSYLRRDPDSGGFGFWVDVLDNRDRNNYQGLVCSFITSTEYQKRFSSIVTHSNTECGP